MHFKSLIWSSCFYVFLSQHHSMWREGWVLTTTINPTHTLCACPNPGACPEDSGCWFLWFFYCIFIWSIIATFEYHYIYLWAERVLSKVETNYFLRPGFPYCNLATPPTRGVPHSDTWESLCGYTIETAPMPRLFSKLWLIIW